MIKPLSSLFAFSSRLSARFTLATLTLCGALSACVIRTSGPYDDCQVDPQYCGDGAITCFVDRDCPTGLLCDRTSSTCVPTSTCYAGQSCPRNHHCDTRATCVPDEWTGGGGRGGSQGGQGGSSGTGTGTGGRTGTGGIGSGGAPGSSTGGTPGSGGAVGTGGATPTGGTTGTGGAPSCQ